MSAPGLRILLLAAGIGERLRPMTECVPKCLTPIGGAPLLDRWQLLLEEAGVTDVTVNIHAHADQVIDRVELLNRRGPVRWRVAPEPALRGSGGALADHLTWLEAGGGPFFIAYADTIIGTSLRDFADEHTRCGRGATLALFRPPDPTKSGVALCDSNGLVTVFEEKPEHPKSTWASAGLLMFDAGVLAEVMTPDAFDISHDVLPRLIGRLHGWQLPGYCRDIGDPEQWILTELDIKCGRLSRWPALAPLSSQMRRAVKIGEEWKAAQPSHCGLEGTCPS